MLIEILVLGSSGAALFYKVNAQRKAARRLSLHKAHTSAIAPRGPRRFSAQRLLHDIRHTIKEKGRNELQLDIDPGIQKAADAARRANNRNLAISTGAVGLALLGSFYPGFAVASAFAVVYLSRELILRVLMDIKRGHYISVYIIDMTSTVGLIVSGQLVLAALGGAIGGFFAKIVNHLERTSQQQLLHVFSGHPQQVWLLRDGAEILVDFGSVQPNDHIVVNAGEVIPVDGTVSTGEGSVDQHILTGESQPIEKTAGNQVFASTLLLSGKLVIAVEKAGNTTVAAKIGEVLEHTQSYKDTLMVRGRTVADSFVPVTLGLTAITLPLKGVQSALAITWASLGDLLAAAGPLCVLSYLQILSRQNILIKDGRVFEALRDVDTIVFDKTGTLTEEEPTVGTIHAFGDFDEHRVLSYAAAAEYRQPHPIAKAITARAKTLKLRVPRPETSGYEVGYGIKVTVDHCTIRVGSARFLEREGIFLPEDTRTIQDKAEIYSYSLVYVGVDDKLAGILELEPTIRAETAEIVRHMKERGMRLYIVSGDHTAATRRMAERLGIENYFAEVLPEHKARMVKDLRDQGRFVCYIGDGINDAIALKSAQVSISLKGASSAATDTAQIIFMDGTLSRLEALFAYAEDFENTMSRNLAISIVPGTIIIAGVYLLQFGVASAMAIFYLSCLLGLGNILWPLVKHQSNGLELPESDAVSADYDLGRVPPPPTPPDP